MGNRSCGLQFISAPAVLRRRSPGSGRIVCGAVLFFDRRATRTSLVPSEVRETGRSPLSQSTRPFPPGGQSWPRTRPADLQTAREWLQIVRDTIEIPPGHKSQRGQQNTPALYFSSESAFAGGFPNKATSPSAAVGDASLFRFHQHSERQQGADRHEIEAQQAVLDQRERMEQPVRLIDRVHAHQEDHTLLLVPHPELLHLAVEVELQRRRDFPRQVALPLFL